MPGTSVRFGTSLAELEIVRPRRNEFLVQKRNLTHFAKLRDATRGSGLLALLLGAMTLLGTKGIATRNKELLGAPVLTTRSKDATRNKGHRY